MHIHNVICRLVERGVECHFLIASEISDKDWKSNPPANGINLSSFLLVEGRLWNLAHYNHSIHLVPTHQKNVFVQNEHATPGM